MERGFGGGWPGMEIFAFSTTWLPLILAVSMSEYKSLRMPAEVPVQMELLRLVLVFSLSVPRPSVVWEVEVGSSMVLGGPALLPYLAFGMSSNGWVKVY